MWNVHGEGSGWKFQKIWKWSKLTTQYNLLKVIFCEYGQGLGKIAVNWFLLWEAKHH